VTLKWTYTNPDPFAGVNGSCVSLASGGGVAVAGGSDGAARTVALSINGTGWTYPVTDPFGTGQSQSVWTDGTRIIAGSDLDLPNNFAHSTDRGATWTPATFSGFTSGPFAGGGGIGAIVYSLAKLGSVWIAGGVGDRLSSPQLGGLVVSTDGGATWATPAGGQPYPSGAGGGGLTLPGVCEAVSASGTLAAAIGVAGTTSFYFVSYSTDGQTWTQTATFPPIPIFSGTHLAPYSIAVVGSRIIVGGQTGLPSICLAYSDDLGTTWTSVFPSGSTGAVTALAYTPKGLLVAYSTGTSQGLIGVSADNGATWTTPASQPFSGASCMALSSIGGTLLAGGAVPVPNSLHAIASSAGLPPTRQFPRDDNLALGAVRQAGRSTSLQNSIRQGSAGTYH
jgi:hypothetical protein